MTKDANPRPAVCFVTNELYPLSPGGIGRLMYNFASHNKSLGSPADLHYLIPRELAERPQVMGLLEATYADMATLHVCPSLAEQPHVLCHLLEQSLKLDWTFDKSYAQSFAYYRGLLAAEVELGRPFDVIEFPDFGGWALATVEARRAGLHFQKTLIAARLHSAQGVIYRSERFAHHPSYWLGVLFDSERHLLAHADIIVGHNQAIIDFNAEHYHLAKKVEGAHPVRVSAGPSRRNGIDRRGGATGGGRARGACPGGRRRAARSRLCLFIPAATVQAPGSVHQGSHRLSSPAPRLPRPLPPHLLWLGRSLRPGLAGAHSRLSRRQDHIPVRHAALGPRGVHPHLHSGRTVRL